MNKERIDDFLVRKDYFENVKQAQSYVMAGLVFINEEKIITSGYMIKEKDIKNINIKYKKKKYVSRAGKKLEKALDYWDINLTDKVMLDIGSSTGGFVDCALQNGIKKVYALDVGTNQLDFKIRNNKQVSVHEQVNFRTLPNDYFLEKFDVITMDVSFISITLLLDNVQKLLKSSGVFICLIKPQFEARKDAKRDKGIISDPKIHEEVIELIKGKILVSGLECVEIIDSPITGTKGNKEFLALIKHKTI